MSHFLCPQDKELRLLPFGQVFGYNLCQRDTFLDLYTKKEGISLCRFKSWTILLIINYRTVKLNSMLTASWHRGVPLPIATSYSCRTVHDVACIAFNFQGRTMLQIVSKDSSVLRLTRMRTWCFYIHRKKLENHYIMTNNLN